MEHQDGEGDVGALEGAGIGFGKQSSAPGKFYDFPGDPVASGTGLRNDGRRPA